MAQYVPWYFKRSPPVFCWPCVPCYTGIWPGRKCFLFLGALLLAFGIMILLGLLLACIAIECSAVAGATLPLAIILIIVGILIFHCGWAAHLLDYGGKIPTDETTYRTRNIRGAEDGGDDSSEDLEVYEKIEPQQSQKPIRQGHWQFDEEKSWQAVSNPYPIQSTHYIDMSNAGPSTSKNYVQLPQYQVLNVSNHQNGKKANTKNVVPEAVQPVMQVFMSNGSHVVDNTEASYCIPISTNQMSGYQVMQSNQYTPMQVINLPQGTTLVPLVPSYSNVDTSQKKSTHIQVVFSEDLNFATPPSSIPMSIANDSAQQKPSDDSLIYVNVKQYARIVQRRGARAKLLQEGRVSKERRKFLHQSRHNHALKRIRGSGGKFDSNDERLPSENETSVCSSPTLSLKHENLTTSIQEDVAPPPRKRKH
ncbi:hypothetical protein M3Y98_00005100 [Aphelenchoides besseyi]|nr:hypothetical protein M3Y98_00005100 [Aphelenchoides besseyi]